MSMSGRLENGSPLPTIILRDLIFEPNPWIVMSCNIVIENCSLVKMDFVSDLTHSLGAMNIFLKSSEIGQSLFEGIGNVTILQCCFRMSRTEDHNQNQIILNATEARISTSFFNNQSFVGSLFKIINGGVLDIDTSNFLNNAIESGMFSVTQGQLKLVNCQFIHNGGFKSNGSCIQARQKSHIHISHSVFRDNIGFYGGVLFAWNHVSVTINQTRFEGNSAEKQGGVIFLTDHSRLSSMNSFYINNRAFTNQPVTRERFSADTFPIRYRDYYSEMSDKMAEDLNIIKQSGNQIKDRETPQITRHSRSSRQGTSDDVTNMQQSDQNQNRDAWKNRDLGGFDYGFDLWQPNGGAILFGNVVSAVFRNDKFTENKAQFYAGAVYAEQFVKHTYIDCTFLKNVAEQNCAGAILSDKKAS